MHANDHFDVVVVGSGSGGGVVASRLSENPDRSVLLLEAGPDFPNEAEITPLFTVSGDCWDPMGIPELDWDYWNHSEPGAYRVRLPRGKLVGGSSMVNGTVAVRGAPIDFDRWASFGNDGWRWEDLLPHFIKLETDADYGSGSCHGDSGPIYVRRYQPRAWAPINHQFFESALSMGIREVADLNSPGGYHNAVGPWPQNRRNAVRQGTLVTYIRAARGRPNFTLRADSLVDRVLFDGQRAWGVQYLDAANEVRTVSADLIVLAAGTYGSPAILQRSGIGREGTLGVLGIKQVAGLPVGEHLLDHTECGIKIQGARLGERHGFQWCVNIRGPLDDRGEPDWQLACTPMDEIEDVAAVFAMLCRQDSEGSLKIASTDPTVPPIIDHRYLSRQSDVERFERAFAFLRELITQPAFAERGTRELSAELTVREIIAGGHVSAHHQSGTCKMGPDGDPTAVVDPCLRVVGTDALMVADASIFPDNVMFNTNLTCYMIGEVAAAQIEGTRADVSTAGASQST